MKAPDKIKPVCSVEDCDRQSATRGLCKMHYDRWRRSGTTELTGRPRKAVTPQFYPDGAEKPHCSVKECPGYVYARGFCRMHHTRWVRHGDITVKGVPRQLPRDVVPHCKEEGCAREAEALGYCKKHWEMFHKYGDTEYRREFLTPEEKKRRDKAATDRYRDENRELVNMRSREYARLHPEKGRERAHVRRAREAAVEWERLTEAMIVAEWGTNCHLCGEPIDFSAPRKPGVEGWERSYHPDHVTPIHLGGPHLLWNVKPAHGLCNVRKQGYV